MPRLDSATLPSPWRTPALRIEILAHATLGLATAVFQIAAYGVAPARALTVELALSAVIAANAWAARGPRELRSILAVTDLTATVALATRIMYGLAICLPYSLDPRLRIALEDPAVGPIVMRKGICETVGVLLQLLRVAPIRDGRNETPSLRSGSLATPSLRLRR